MVITIFSIFDKLNYLWFSQQIFLLANFNIKNIFCIFFLTFNNINVEFIKKKQTWKIYIIKIFFKIIYLIKFINKKN